MISITPTPGDTAPERMRPDLPAPPPPLTRDTAPRRVARVEGVFGRAELQLDDKTFTPASYLRVILRGMRQEMETLTAMNGDFFFEQVPPGDYTLVFMTADKESRVVYRMPLVVRLQERLRLPAIHIPLDSMTTLRARST